ncbi:MAG TPA: oligosaccharide flippase family protein [Puia sp.]|jgi:O-antigen/teichoic acid export membrane protein
MYTWLVKRNFTVLLIQLTGMGLAFGGNVLLARLYGEQVYGVYSLLTSWAFFLAAIALFGIDDTHLVRIPSLRLQGEKRSVLFQLRWSLEVNTIAIFVVAAFFWWLVNIYRLPGLAGDAYYCNVLLVITGLLALFNNLVCFLRALDKVVAVEITDKIIRPFVFVGLLLLFYYLWRTDLLMGAMMANIASLIAILLLSSVIIARALTKIPDNGKTAKKGFSLSANFRYVSMNLLYLLSIRMDILLLGTMSSAVNVGHYNVAIRFADILAYPIAIMNLSLPALLAKHRHDNGGMPTPASMYTIAKSVTLQCLLLGLLFLPAGNWILSWYGKGFTSALPVVGLFFLSGLITAATGSIDIFLIMNGQEKKVIYCRIVTILLMPLLAVFLIPRWGMIGAAVLSLAGNLVYNVLLEWFFYKRYGMFIHPFASSRSINSSNGF